MEIQHIQRETKGFFKAVSEEQEEAGVMTYHLDESGHMVIDHTIVREAFNGQGIGKKLVNAAVDFVRESGMKIIPICPFAKKVLEGSTSYKDILV